MLARVGAGPDVRLACQLRPLRDLSVVPLVPPQMEAWGTSWWRLASSTEWPSGTLTRRPAG